ncbi:MAG TPA: LysE family translocator [Thermomicrobiales bacterium]|nr:LysE family translocator [Thermomicrobiales bacterium]
MSPEFLLTSLVVVLMPGAGVLYTLAAGFSRGKRASVVAAFGCTLGIIPHVAAALLGVAALLYASAVAFQTLKYLGVAYLLYLAWRTWREEGALKIEATADARSAREVIVSAILVNTLNPKLSIFFLAFLPQFVRGDDPDALPRMVGLSAVFMALTFVIFVAYGLGAAAIRRHLVARPRALTWMRRAFAGALVGLGAKLALAQR